MCRPLWARYRARLPSFWLCSSSFCNRRNYNKITPRVYCVTCFILSYKLSSRLQNWSQLPLSRALSHSSVADGAELLAYPRRRKGKTCSNMQRSETRLSKTSGESRSLELENCILVSAWPWILVGTSHGLYFDILFVFDFELLKQWARIFIQLRNYRRYFGSSWLETDAMIRSIVEGLYCNLSPEELLEAEFGVFGFRGLYFVLILLKLA